MMKVCRGHMLKNGHALMADAFEVVESVVYTRQSIANCPCACPAHERPTASARPAHGKSPQGRWRRQRRLITRPDAAGDLNTAKGCILNPQHLESPTLEWTC